MRLCKINRIFAKILENLTVDFSYHPELEEELKECLFCLRRNEMMFDLEVDTDLIEQRIYERQALLCRYRYLLARARELGLHTVLTKYQPAGQV